MVGRARAFHVKRPGAKTLLARTVERRLGLVEWRDTPRLVLGTAFLATELDETELSEAFQPILSGVLGSAASMVPGLQVASTIFVNSVMSGTANAFLTLRIGLIAQQYSRALVRPERAVVRRTAIVQAAGMLGSIVAGGAKQVSGSLRRAVTRPLAGMFSGVEQSVRAAGAAVARRFSSEDEAEDGDGEGTAETA